MDKLELFSNLRGWDFFGQIPVSNDNMGMVYSEAFHCKENPWMESVPISW